MSYAASVAPVKPLVRGPGTGSGQAAGFVLSRMLAVIFQ
jgi:hypothetical protein